MKIILHRVNDPAALAKLPVEFGAEIDLRTYGTRLILNHEPKADGPLFEEWLEGYRHKTLILNPKEEGLEDEILGLLKRRGIEDFFFLDLTVPMMVKLARRGETRMAVRFSEYESIETCLRFAGLVQWAWVDCFSRWPLDVAVGAVLNENFRLCLAAPELEGHNPRPTDAFLQPLAGIRTDAVCTDHPDLWTASGVNLVTAISLGMPTR